MKKGNCSNCGAKLKAGMKFCSDCGQEIIKKREMKADMKKTEIKESKNNSKKTDKKTPSSTPSKTTRDEDMEYAGFWIRVLACIIDTVILWSINFALAFVFIIPLALFEDSLIGNLMDSLLSLVSILITFVYYILLTYKYGATLGKKALGLRVVSSDGAVNELGLAQIILRETLGKIISFVIIYIGFIMVAFTDKKQGLHDMMAGTYVIKKK